MTATREGLHAGAAQWALVNKVPRGRQAVEVRGVNSFSSPHAVHPIVQVIHRDEEHVGNRLFCLEETKRESKKDEKKSFLHNWKGRNFSTWFDKRSTGMISQGKEGGS